MDIHNYALYQERGLVSVQDIDDDWIDAQITYHQNEIDNLNAMKADLQKSVQKI